MPENETTPTPPDNQQTQQTPEPQGNETNWVQEARKWEDRAKANKKALDEAQKTLDQFKAESEKREQKEKSAAETIEELRTKLAEANAAAERDKMVRSVAKDTGADAEILLLMKPTDETQAREYAKRYLDSIKEQAPKSKWPDVKDKGESKAPMTKKEILEIEDPKERRKAIADNIDLFRKG